MFLLWNPRNNKKRTNVLVCAHSPLSLVVYFSVVIFSDNLHCRSHDIQWIQLNYELFVTMLGVVFFLQVTMIKIGGMSFFKFKDSIGGRWDPITIGEGLLSLNWPLSQSIPIKLVSPSSHRSLWVFTSTSWKFSSLMCQHGMACLWRGFFSILCSFYKQRVSVALQQTQTAFILKHVLIISEKNSKLNIFPNVSPLSLSNMLLAIGGVRVLDLFLCS